MVSDIRHMLESQGADGQHLSVSVTHAPSDTKYSTLYSLRKLRVRFSWASWDFSIRALFESPPSPALRDIWLTFLKFGKESQGG